METASTTENAYLKSCKGPRRYAFVKAVQLENQHKKQNEKRTFAEARLEIEEDLINYVVKMKINDWVLFEQWFREEAACFPGLTEVDFRQKWRQMKNHCLES